MRRTRRRLDVRENYRWVMCHSLRSSLGPQFSPLRLRWYYLHSLPAVKSGVELDGCCCNRNFWVIAVIPPGVACLILSFVIVILKSEIVSFLKYVNLQFIVFWRLACTTWHLDIPCQIEKLLVNAFQEIIKISIISLNSILVCLQLNIN